MIQDAAVASTQDTAEDLLRRYKASDGDTAAMQAIAEELSVTMTSQEQTQADILRQRRLDQGKGPMNTRKDATITRRDRADHIPQQPQSPWLSQQLQHQTVEPTNLPGLSDMLRSCDDRNSGAIRPERGHEDATPLREPVPCENANATTRSMSAQLQRSANYAGQFYGQTNNQKRHAHTSATIANA